MADARDSNEALVGACLGDTYRIGRQLGSGGMGVVFEADHVRLPRRFAVKVLRGDRRDPKHVDLFRREAENACRLRHRHIVDVIDFNAMPDGTHYIVMELLFGEDLSQRLARKRRLPMGEVQSILRQTASAISAAHAAGIVHSDLKPSNLFLSQRGASDDYVKVLDFGMSRLAFARESATSGRIAGTPSYMAPEQVSSLSLADPRSDIWSLGVIAYQMLSGRLPFEGPLPEVVAKIVGEDPAPLPGVDRRHAAELEPILVRALAKRPEERYPGVQEFLDEFVAAARRALGTTDWREEQTPTGEWADVPTRNDIVHAETLRSLSFATPTPADTGPASVDSFAELSGVQRATFGRRAERVRGSLMIYSDGFLGATVNISCGGALIKTHRHFVPGKRIRLQFSVPGIFGMLAAVGRVVRWEDRARGAGSCVALEFEELSPETYNAVAAYVAWVQSEQQFGWRVLRIGDEVVVPVFGTLAGHDVLRPLLAQIGAETGTIVFNLRDLRRLNSAAVSAWIRFMVALSKRGRVRLEECSVPFLETALLVPNLVFGVRIRSFYLPSYCSSCGAEEDHLATVRDLAPTGGISSSAAERARCFTCGEQVTFEDFSSALLGVVHDTRR